MSDARTRCSNCGAMPSRVDARFCDCCGTELPHPERAAVPDAAGAPTAPNSPEEIERRFSLLDRHPDVPGLKALHAPHHRAPIALPILFASLALFGAIGIGLALSSTVFLGPLAIVPLVLIVIAVAGIGHTMLKTRAFNMAPVQHIPALVVDERTKITSVGSSTAQANTFATLQFPDGTRHELRTHDAVCGKITTGDMGIAFVKAGLLVDFGRVSV